MTTQNIPLFLTNNFLENAWIADKPRDYVYNYLSHQFDRLRILYEFMIEEQKMYSNQILLDLIFLKNTLK